MSFDDACALLRRLYSYESLTHFDGYEVALAEYRTAETAYPITVAAARARVIQEVFSANR